MDTGVPAAGPWLVLALAALGLLALAGVLLRIGRRPAVPPAPSGFVDDDLPDFLAFPPGTRPAPRSARTVAARAASAPVPLAGPGTPVALADPNLPRTPAALPPESPAGLPASGVRLPATLVAGALVLIAVAAVVALLSRTGTPRSGGPAAAPPTGAAAPSAVPLPVPPSSPVAGQGGAGLLAYTSVPVGRDGEVVRLSFGGVVLERYAAGVRAAYPTVGITRAGGQALVHVQLPTFNCFSADAPADPVPTGCAPSLTEYADLPTPALTVSRSGGELTLAGRFATYTRPNGSGPSYTGRVYDLTIGVVEGRPGRDGGAPASGTLTLGGETARTVGGPDANGARSGG